MGKSYKKHFYSGITCARSEKQDKKINHKKMRARERQILYNYNKDEDFIMPVKDEISDVWEMAKDGKQYFGDLENEGGWGKKLFRKLKRK